MLKKVIYFCFYLILPLKTYATSPWEGTWEIGRYTTAMGGRMTITDCQNNVCNFYVRTWHGTHMCEIDGKLKTNGNQAQHRKKSPYEYDKNEKYAVIDFELNPQKNIIEVKGNYIAQHLYCGMRGIFTGEYENENNPLRYETGFDCWANDINDTQKTICADEELSQADKEMSEKYKDMMTSSWNKKRDECQTDTDCLWNFYVTSIKQGYQKSTQKEVNLYEYLGNIKKDELFYPTDLTLLVDYFKTHMKPKDYKEWKIAFSDMSLEDYQCENCLYHEYGVAGLYTITESVFYINKDEIWIAFIYIDDVHEENNHIIIYAPQGKTLKDIPEQYQKWLKRVKPFYPNDIIIKNFS